MREAFVAFWTRQKIGVTDIIHTFLHDETEVATNLFFRIVTYMSSEMNYRKEKKLYIFYSENI